jgi:AsmA protein
MHATAITLHAPQVRLVRGSGGRWNYSSLGAQKGKAKNAPAAPSTSATDLSIDKLSIEDGRLTVVRGGQERVYEDVQLTMKHISPTSAMPFDFSAKTPGAGKMSAEGKIGPLDPGDTAASPMEAKIEIEHLDLATTGFTQGMGGVLDYRGNLDSDGKKAEMQGKVHVEKLKLVASGGPSRQPVNFDYATVYDVKRQAGSLTKGDIKVGGTTAKLTGNFDGRGELLVAHMKLVGNNMPVNDIEGLLPALGVTLPSGSSLEGGTVSTNLSLDGPLEHLVISGPVNVSNTRLTGFNLASKMSAISALAGMHTGSDTGIQTMSSNLRVAPDGIQASNINVVMPSLGTVTGSGTIGPTGGMNFRMVAALNSGGGAAGALSQLTTLGHSKGTIPFLITGTTSNPVFVPDVAGAVANSLTAPVQEGGGILGGLFGKKKPK